MTGHATTQPVPSTFLVTQDMLFRERFGIPLDRKEAETEFVVRTRNIVLSYYGSNRKYLFDRLIYTAAVDVQPTSRSADGSLIWSIRDIRRFVDKLDFRSALVVLEALYNWYQKLEDGAAQIGDEEGEWRAQGRKNDIAEKIQDMIRRAGGVLNIRWERGNFWPAGAPELDEALVDSSLNWVRVFDLPSVGTPLEKALRHLLNADDSPEYRQDAITDAYEALESLAKIVTQKNKDLSGNRQYFASSLGMDRTYSHILKEYINRGCQFRHGAAESRPVPDHAETEMFVYLTGVFIRFAFERRERWAAKVNN